MSEYKILPVPAVSVAVFRGDVVLLVRRGKPHYRGLWSLPGGSIKTGETMSAAARRELEEETGLLAQELRFSDVSDVIVREDGILLAHYVILTFAARDVAGEAKAGSDACEIGWFDRQARMVIETTPKLEEAIFAAEAALKKGTADDFRV